MSKVSDQPKSTTGERTTGEWTCGGDDIQPKPATDEWHGQIHDDREHDGEPKPGEWTAEYVHDLERWGWKRIADAHNAALAAERESKDAYIDRITELSQQLAAERKKLQVLVDALKKVKPYIHPGVSPGILKELNLTLENIKNGMATIRN